MAAGVADGGREGIPPTYLRFDENYPKMLKTTPLGA